MEFTGERYVPSLRGKIYYEHVHRYVVAARFCAGQRVLDVASGEGYGAALLARVAAHVVGIDLDEAAIEHARHAYHAPNLRFQSGSCQDIPLADRSIDVIASFETIEHVDGPERTLDEFRRVLAPDGVLVLSSPNKLVYSDLPGYHNPHHIRELYLSELRDMLCERFENVALYGQRLVAASLVHPLASATTLGTPWVGRSSQQIDEAFPAAPGPEYFVAVCGNKPFLPDASSAFLDPDDDLFGDMTAELVTLRRHYALTVPSASAALEPAASGPAAELERERARSASLQAALENTEASLRGVQRTCEAAQGLIADLRAALGLYRQQLESIEAARLSVHLTLAELVDDAATAKLSADREHLTQLLADRERQLADTLVAAEGTRTTAQAEAAAQLNAIFAKYARPPGAWDHGT
jgi:SAM-dependent methyltransferase